MLTPRVIRAVIDAANQAKKPVIVDPKGLNYSIYRGVTLITPNRQELAAATRRRADTESEIVAAAEELARLVESQAVLVTRSEDGMSLLVKGEEPVHIAAYPVKVRDVSGAGDTVAASRSSRSPRSPFLRFSARRFPFPNCARGFFPRHPSRRKKRFCSTGRCSRSG